MKRIFAIVLSLLFCFSLFACSSGSESGSTDSPNGGSSDSGDIVLPEIITNKTYRSFWLKQFNYKTMPIVAYNAAPQKTGSYTLSMITDEHYREIADAGINTVFGLYERAEVNAEEIRAALALCEKYDLSYVAVGNGLASFSDVGIAESSLYNSLLKDSPSALGGVIVKDEPNEKQFAKIAASKEVLRQLFGKKLLYHSNLYPDYATAAQLFGDESYPSGYSYEKYVENYCKTYSPQILSYDYYPFQKTKILDGYFVNMSTIRKYAEQYEIPFWVYIQCCSFNKYTKIPDNGELKWLVNTSLAYGCKGLQYFTYVDALSGGNETFSGSPIDKNGNKTETYGYISDINKFVGNIDEYLMCCFSKGIMTAGTTPCPIPDADVLQNYGKLSSVGGDSVLVGCLDYKGQNAYYVVNNSVDDFSDVNLDFSQSVSGSMFSSDGESTFSGEKYSARLSAGEGILLILD